MNIHKLFSILAFLTLNSAFSQEATDPVASLKRENEELHATIKQQAAEIERLKALNTTVLARIATLEEGIPSEQEAQAALERVVEEQSEKRFRLTRFKKTDGRKDPLSGYLMAYEAEIDVLTRCFWEAGTLWDGKFYTSTEPRSAGQTFVDNTMGHFYVLPGNRVRFEGVFALIKSERGWNLQMLEQKFTGNGTVARPSESESARPASTPAAATPTPRKSVLLTEVKIANDTFGPIDIFWNDNASSERVPAMKLAFKKLEVGSTQKIRVIGQRGSFERTFVVPRVMQALRIDNNDFKR